MKNCIYLIISILLLIIPSKVFANCSYEKIAELQNIAANVNYDYTYIENDNDVQFQIRFTNLDNRVYIYDDNNNKSYYVKNQTETILSGFKPGVKYKFSIKSYGSLAENQTVTVKVIENGEWVDKTYVTGSTSQECNDSLKTIYINLPYYNKFYKDDACKGLEEYEVCQKWSHNSFTYDQFKNEISKLKNDNNKYNEVSKNSVDKNLFEIALEFIIKYYYLAILIVLLIVPIIIILFKNRKSGFEGW